MSSARCSRVCQSRGATGSESPSPRMLNRITRLKEASRRKNRATEGHSHSTSRLNPPGRTTRSTGPSPNTWYAMWTPSAVFV
jgi:hypothetical protein